MFQLLLREQCSDKKKKKLCIKIYMFTHILYNSTNSDH